MNVATLAHPDYNTDSTLWTKFRLTYEAGDAFIEAYLEKFSERESAADFAARKKTSYCPAHAKSAIIDIKNAIFQRMFDVVRMGGPDSYIKAANDGGVDKDGHDMNTFIGSIILPELLAMGKVGVFIDKPEVREGATKLDVKDVRPYLYHYKAEDIKSWAYDTTGQLIAVLLKDTVEVTDEETGLVKGFEAAYRLVTLDNGNVTVYTYDKDGTRTSFTTLRLTKLPFVIISIGQSLLTDVANYQIAIMNLGSSDMAYALKSNYPFYTEQTKIGDVSNQSSAIRVGVTQGRRYPAGTDRPAFINPSSEPMKVSMEKQDKLEADIKKLVNLAVKSLQQTKQSAESKKQDNQGLEAGLSYIGSELQSAERLIANSWCEYEGAAEPVKIQYPTNYSLRTDEERRAEAKELLELAPTVPSMTYQKAIAKRVAQITVGQTISQDDLNTIMAEIDATPVVVTSPDTIKTDFELGLVGSELASKLRGYPAGEVEKAKADHAERAARIVKAQTSGVPDTGNDPKADENSKKFSQDQATSVDSKSGTRGEGQ